MYIWQKKNSKSLSLSLSLSYTLNKRYLLEFGESRNGFFDAHGLYCVLCGDLMEDDGEEEEKREGGDCLLYILYESLTSK